MSNPADFWTSIKSASMSTLVYSVLLTPFDVVKNTQISAFVRKGAFATITNLVRDTGTRTLWRGLIPASASTFFSNIIYYPCYELTKTQFQQVDQTWGSGFAAMFSRSLTVVITLPLERLRTSIQGIGKGEINLSQRGLRPTLFRDIIFSFTYFTIWENLYRGLKPFDLQGDRTLAIFVGSLVAAVITHPFDVVKTKVQTRFELFEEYDRRIVRALLDIYRMEGVSGLYIGSYARISKIVIGLMIYTNLYEYVKSITAKKDLN